MSARHIISAGFHDPAGNGNRGPWLYIEHGGFMLHFYWRRFRGPGDKGTRGCFTLNVRGRRRISRAWGDA